jgi:hypothetical protein
MAAQPTQAEFQQVLAATLSPEEAPREQAEAYITGWLAQPDWFTANLILALSTASAVEIRTVAALTFRRHIFNITDQELSLWPRCQPATHLECKTRLLASLGAETDASVRKKIGDAISVLAQMLISDAESVLPQSETPAWPELLQALWQSAGHANGEMREIGLHILSEVPNIFGSQLERYLGEVGRLIQGALADPLLAVKVAGSRAFVSFVVNLDKRQQAAFVPLFPALLQVITQACAEDELSARDVLTAVVELAEIEPKFMRPNMEVLTQQMMLIAKEGGLEDGTRRLGVEVLVVLSEEAPAMVRKFPGLVQQLIPLLILFCSEIEEDEEWPTQDQDDIPEEDQNSTVGEQSLDRVACALGGNIVLPEVFKLLPTLLADQAKWQNRAAALSTIAAIAEGCLEQLRTALDQVVAAVAPRLIDPHPRVRYAACNSIGQLSLDYAPDPSKPHQSSFQSLHHAAVVPHLLKLMEDPVNCRVQAHGAAALVNFCEHANKEVLAPYLNDILTRLGAMLQSPFKIVLEQTVTAIATVADSSEKLFQTYYPHFMPLLKQILVTANDPKYRLLRGKTMECISLIGIAVGKEVFAADAADVMGVLQQSQVAGMEDDDPQISYMLAAWARMCEILGTDFMPYLQYVMPPLIKSVQLEAKVIFLDTDDNEEDLDGGAENWEVVPVADDKRIGIKTSILEEKSTACEMLKIYVSQLGGGFAPYVANVSTIMIGLLEFVFEEKVRMCAASTLAPLLYSAMQEPTLLVRVPEMWANFAPALIKAANNETDHEVLSWQIESVKDCIEQIGTVPGCITPELIQQVAAGIVCWMDDYEGRYRQRLSEKEDEDYDADADVKLQEDEQTDVEIIQQIAHLMHALFVTLKDDFLAYFDHLNPYFLRMMTPERPSADRQWALCVFDDLVEACGAQSVKYAAQFVPAILGGLQDKTPAVRQAASYGIGVMASVVGDPYVEQCKQALPILQQVIQAPTSRDFGNLEATENAISAILKIVQNPACGVPLATMLPGFLQMLPFKEDQEEADYVYGFLCELIMNSDPAMTPECLARFLFIMAESLNTALVPLESETGLKCRQTIQHMQAVGAEAMAGLFAQLPAEQQTKLKVSMGAAGPASP